MKNSETYQDKDWRHCLYNSTLYKKRKRSTLDSRDYAQWYQLWVTHNNYSQVLFRHLEPYLEDNYVLVDIGAGVGALAVPIAKRIQKVIAVEPSTAMAEGLIENIRKEEDITIEIINERWEEVDIENLEKCDVVLASHSLYLMENIEKSLKKMFERANNYVFIIIGTGRQPTFLYKLWQAFKNEEYKPYPGFIQLYNKLYDMGIMADVTFVQNSCNYVYADLKQATEQWLQRLNLPFTEVKELQKYLKGMLKKKEEFLWLEDNAKNAIIKIEI